MGSGPGWIVPLSTAIETGESAIGAKASKLAALARAGHRVPSGFAITTDAYRHFVQSADLEMVVRLELGRKPLDSMRWEELWDAALRLRSAFLGAPVPARLAAEIAQAARGLGAALPMAVRSSAPGEDSAGTSFAGLHESVTGVRGERALLDAVRVVWASLWSDAALLYRREMGLDPRASAMAVVVQQMIECDRSGVAFARDPRDTHLPYAIVEAVPGRCELLVDGSVDPDRWVIERDTGRVAQWHAGARDADGAPQTPLLDAADLRAILRALLDVEGLFGWPPDMEWTGRAHELTLLQARPITTARDTDGGDLRGWYLSLRPGAQRLRELRRRVSGELIPALRADGERLAAQELESLDDATLASCIHERLALLQHWKQVYHDDFIPFAHGVRRLGIYYNDAVKPDDAYEFVGLLGGSQMLAMRRNRTLGQLAGVVRANPALAAALAGDPAARTGWQDIAGRIAQLPGGAEFAELFNGLLDGYMDVAVGGERLCDRPELLLAPVMELAAHGGACADGAAPPDAPRDLACRLEQKLMEALDPARHAEAREVLETGRVSWQLRDDDNLLLGRIESQLLRAVQTGAARLREQGRLAGDTAVGEEAAAAVAGALRSPGGGPLELPPEPQVVQRMPVMEPGESARQLLGQPGAPGMATGLARCIVTQSDIAGFRAGEVLVCDAIQPNITHLVPLACAIVERRGGMLIHGAIVARELGIPCVNGIPEATRVLQTGDIVTVDGYLGIVTIGTAEFSLEGIALDV